MPTSSRVCLNLQLSLVVYNLVAKLAVTPEKEPKKNCLCLAVHAPVPYRFRTYLPKTSAVLLSDLATVTNLERQTRSKMGLGEGKKCPVPRRKIKTGVFPLLNCMYCKALNCVYLVIVKKVWINKLCCIVTFVQERVEKLCFRKKVLTVFQQLDNETAMKLRLHLSVPASHT